jgi:hypothetical protein
MLMGAHHGPVDVVLLPIQLTARVGTALHFSENVRPQPAALPPIEPGGDGLPGAIAFGQVPPWCASLGDPEHTVDDAPVIMIRAAPSSRIARWQ